jgi:ferredoxin-NADP reductase
MSIETFSITLEKAFMLAPNTKHFIFRCSKTPVFDYLPGQFITLHFEHEQKQLRRSYSIANVPSQNNCIEIAAGYVEGGPGTKLLFNLKPGESLQASGPYGRLVLKDELPKRYILVATSTGITPYRAMMAELIQQMERFPALEVVVLQGVQTRQDILYGDEFTTLAEEYPQVTFMCCLSREDDSQLSAHEYKGYVQNRFPELLLNPEEDLIYLCGNPGMIDDAFLQLKELGFSMQQIIREKYLSR